jgi:hypothetical protein
MFHYLISYDLSAPEKKYKVLEEAIERLGSCEKKLETTWLLNTELTLNDLHDHLVLSKGIDENDALLIIEVKEPNKDTYIYKAPNFSSRSLSKSNSVFLGDIKR